jgi:hypothetical protein
MQALLAERTEPSEIHRMLGPTSAEGQRLSYVASRVGPRSLS